MTKAVTKVLRNISEVKRHNRNLNIEVNTGGQVMALSAVGQGVALTQRIGEKIWPRSLTILMNLENLNVGAQIGSVARVMIVRSRLHRALIPSDMPATVSATSDYTKFFVLYDKWLTVSGNAGAGPQTIVRKVHIGRKRFLRVEFEGTLTTVGAHLLYAFFIGDVTAGNVNAPDIEFSSSLSYNDL